MNIILPEPSRIDKLKGWLRTYRYTLNDVAKHMDLTARGVLLIINAETARPERVKQLKTLGVPEELLPEARYITPGRQRKCAANQEDLSPDCP